MAKISYVGAHAVGPAHGALWPLIAPGDTTTTASMPLLNAGATQPSVPIGTVGLANCSRRRDREASIAIRRDLADEFTEILGFSEISVDRGKTDVGDLIEAGERLHDQFADHVAGDFGLARAFELPNYRVDDAFDPVGLMRPLAQSGVGRAGELVTVERLALSILLDHRQLAELDALEGGEPCGAVRTGPPATNRAAIVGWPRVLDLAVIGPTERASHPLYPCAKAGARRFDRRKTVRCAAAIDTRDADITLIPVVNSDENPVDPQCTPLEISSTRRIDKLKLDAPLLPFQLFRSVTLVGFDLAGLRNASIEGQVGYRNEMGYLH